MSDKIPPRIEITATLEVIAPIHIGDGGTRLLGFKKDEAPKSGATKDTPAPTSAEAGQPTVATVVRDGKDRPYLPSTTLKGFLRSLGEEIQQAASADQPDTLTDKLFGRIKTSDPGADVPLGTMGALIVRGGRMLKAGQTDGLPFCSNPPDANGKVAVSEVDKGLPPGTFIAARTRIDPASGTAADSALFHAEKVARGTTFELRLLLAPRSDADTDNLFNRLAEILAGLSTNGGRPIGKGAAENSGRVRLVSNRNGVTPKVIVKTLNKNGDWVEDRAHGAAKLKTLQNARPQATAKPAFGHSLMLVCPGPYIVIDSSRRAKRRTGVAAYSEPMKIRPQSQYTNKKPAPMIDPAGVAGYLRSRACFLLAKSKISDSKYIQNNVIEMKKIDNPDRVFSSADTIESLTSVERLFGITGYKARIGIFISDITADETIDLTSVKIDRLSGAPVDNALFTTVAFLGSRFSLEITYNAEQIEKSSRAADLALLKSLIEDIKYSGLQLGHGVNKGFGWFEAVVK